MTLVIPEGFAQVAYRFALENDPEVMVSTVGVAMGTVDPDNQGNLDTLADDFIAAFPASGMYAGWTFLGCNARVGGGGGGVITVESPRTHTGTLVGETPPQNCTVLLKKFSAQAGREHRGRMYLPPFCLAESSVTKAGIITPTALTEIQTAVDAWLGSASGFYILHDSASPASTPTQVTNFGVDRMIATQRRRLRR